jgi:hypothetical protein
MEPDISRQCNAFTVKGHHHLGVCGISFQRWTVAREMGDPQVLRYRQYVSVK